VQIAGAIQVSKGAMTNTVARLHAKGLLDVNRAGTAVAGASVEAFGLVGVGFFHGLVAAVPCSSGVRPL